MANANRIMSLCPRCKGTGLMKDPLDDSGEETELVTCSDCEGAGAIHTGWVVKVNLEQGEEEPPLSTEPEE